VTVPPERKRGSHLPVLAGRFWGKALPDREKRDTLWYSHPEKEQGIRPEDPISRSVVKAHRHAFSFFSPFAGIFGAVSVYINIVSPDSGIMWRIYCLFTEC
jgi:hypothetical protein